MRVLVTTGDFCNYLVPNFFNLLTELKQHLTIDICHQSGEINDIIRQLETRPDLVFINEFGESNSPKITGLDALTIPYVLLMYDLHYQSEARNKALQDLRPRLIFSLYRDQFYHRYPDFAHKMHWLPHHVDTNLYKDYGLTKDIDFLLMGDVTKRVYPLRNHILQTMKDQPGFVYHPHPGWRVFSETDKPNLFIGENYAREINRAKIFFTCDSIYHYPLLKYFEVLACNTLLLAPVSNDLINLGFIPGVHFVAIDESNFQSQAEYYLTHEAERLQIARQGYEMVHSLHSTARRAREIAEVLRSLVV